MRTIIITNVNECGELVHTMKYYYDEDSKLIKKEMLLPDGTILDTLDEGE